MMQREAEQFFLGPLYIYLQHFLQIIIYFIKIQFQNIYLKNTPGLPD